MNGIMPLILKQKHRINYKTSIIEKLIISQFSTKKESLFSRGNCRCGVIGITNMPEAQLAREAEICYPPTAILTDFDCWHYDHENVEYNS